jgi:HTH-type transcriptional regulator/antitoxin HigA
MITAKHKISGRYLDLIRQFPLRPIRTKSEANAATKILDCLFGHEDVDPGEADYVGVLTNLLDVYEREHDRLYHSDESGLEVLRELVKQHGMKQSKLAAKLGISAPAVSLIMSGHRPITADHARALGKVFSVEPGAFI